ncbi:MAG TPA: ATP-binding cassette domain-containing protein, partial [Labilithrix sp.]
AAPNVLEDVSFDWPPGRVLLLEGHNGCGKSTVLRLLLGLRAPATGTLAIGATDLATVDASALRAQVAYLPQRPWLGAPTTTVREAIALLEPDASDDVMRAALGRVGLDSLLRGDVLDAIVGELSAGQRQRLALARTLTHDAPIVLLDEPDANLDAEGAERVAAIARALAESGKMVAIAAHSAVLRTLDAVHVDLSAPRRAGSPV